MEKGKWPTWQEACQRHANYYIHLLMNPSKTPEELYIELGQMNLAFKRLKEEEVGSEFHPGMVEIRLRQVTGGFVNTHLPKLFDGSATEEDANEIAVAIDSVRVGYEYPVNVEVLEAKYKAIYKMSPITVFTGKDEINKE